MNLLTIVESGVAKTKERRNTENDPEILAQVVTTTTQKKKDVGENERTGVVIKNERNQAIRKESDDSEL